MTLIPDSWLIWWQGLPFTQPFALFLLLLFPLAFLVLLLRQLQMNVGSLLLFRDLPQRVLFQNLQLKHQWHRWVYIGIFGLLTLIAAGLSLPQPGQRHVIVIDDSASMGAVIDPMAPDADTVWNQATEAVKRAAERAQSRGQAVVIIRLSDYGLIGADRNGQRDASVDETMAQALDAENLALQLAALDEAVPQALPFDLAERTRSLGGFVGAQGVGRLTIVTDRPLGEQATLGEGITWIDVTNATPAINLGFVAVREKQNPFDRDSQVVLQNLSDVSVAGAKLEVRSINNPVSVPVLTGIDLAPNARLELDIASLRQRAEILGSGPLRLSVVHHQDSLEVDNHLWLVRPTQAQMSVAMVRCQGDAPLLDQLMGVEGLEFRNFGDITSLSEMATDSGMADDLDPEFSDAGLNEQGLGLDLLADQNRSENQLQSFDLVIYDRCLLSPLYEELATDSIVIEVQVNTSGGGFDRIGPEDADAVVRAAWQAPASRSPVLNGVRSLIDLPLVSQTVRPLPQAHKVIGLLSDLDPNRVAGQAEQDVFAPSNLLQAFVAWNGVKTRLDIDTGVETSLAPNQAAPKMLYLGFDPHLACAGNVLDERMDGVPLAEASAAAQNGPDDCLALTLLVINSIEWMRQDRQPNGQDAGFQRQYLSTGESFRVQSTARDEGQDGLSGQREYLARRVLSKGQSGAERVFVSAVDLNEQLPIDRPELVRWQLTTPDLHEYRGTKGSFDLSVGLFNEAESRLTRAPLGGSLRIDGAAANADRQDLTRLLVLILFVIMGTEALIAAFLPRWRQSPGRRRVAAERDTNANSGSDNSSVGEVRA